MYVLEEELVLTEELEEDEEDELEDEVEVVVAVDSLISNPSIKTQVFDPLADIA